MEQDRLVPQYQQLATQLLRISPLLYEFYQDQLALVKHVNAQNMFKLDREQHRIVLANALFHIQFNTPQQIQEGSAKLLAEPHFHNQQVKSENLEEFFLQDIYFLTGDQKPQHSPFLRDKAQKLRKLFIEQVYSWVNGPERVAEFLKQISLAEAELIDQVMIETSTYTTPYLQQYVLSGRELPQQLLQLIQKIFTLEYLVPSDFLPIQSLMHSLDEFCFSAPQFLHPAIYCIISLSFEERFNLHELNEHVHDIELLFRHAQEHPHLLGFARLMNREMWRRDDLLSKKHFLERNNQLWQKKVAKLPLFDCSRVVNWLFRQSAEVLDWISMNIQHSSVRVAVTAISFLDTHQVHPQVILATLQYFQYVSARLFIHSVYQYAIEHKWFQHPQNQSVVLKGTRQSVNDHRIAISPSILYLDEWMGLMRDVVNMDDQSIKKVYLGLSRVMQAYLQHLHKITIHLPETVQQYIHPSNQQDRDFYAELQRHRIKLSEFRQLFYLQDGNIRESVFDSYVRDYLAEYLIQHTHISKNLTWKGLFNQAVAWHTQIQKQEIIERLKKDFALRDWKSLTTEPCIYYRDWTFQELKTIDQIIEQTRSFRNCLAASYAKRIIEGEYVAFYVSYGSLSVPLLLGCNVQDRQLIFDQLEYPNNQKAEPQYIHIAKEFTDWLNQRLATSCRETDLDVNA
ncbi:MULTISPECIES: hypothetical protein [Acinetobacter]|uniref:hypothetical protein n=2 Tax=Moraxellaceae TaxID=468 RepID=UPI0005390064|nr:hypothetical protein [Acinetobacter sp. HR7]KGT47080.1 hypothetical protein GW12_18780 [Acinetobacter sp. HR7]